MPGLWRSQAARTSRVTPPHTPLSVAAGTVYDQQLSPNPPPPPPPPPTSTAPQFLSLSRLPSRDARSVSPGVRANSGAAREMRLDVEGEDMGVGWSSKNCRRGCCGDGGDCNNGMGDCSYAGAGYNFGGGNGGGCSYSGGVGGGYYSDENVGCVRSSPRTEENIGDQLAAGTNPQDLPVDHQGKVVLTQNRDNIFDKIGCKPDKFVMKIEYKGENSFETDSGEEKSYMPGIPNSDKSKELSASKIVYFKDENDKLNMDTSDAASFTSTSSIVAVNDTPKDTTKIGPLKDNYDNQHKSECAVLSENTYKESQAKNDLDLLISNSKAGFNTGILGAVSLQSLEEDLKTNTYPIMKPKSRGKGCDLFCFSGGTDGDADDSAASGNDGKAMRRNQTSQDIRDGSENGGFGPRMKFNDDESGSGGGGESSSCCRGIDNTAAGGEACGVDEVSTVRDFPKENVTISRIGVCASSSDNNQNNNSVSSPPPFGGATWENYRDYDNHDCGANDVAAVGDGGRSSGRDEDIINKGYRVEQTAGLENAPSNEFPCNKEITTEIHARVDKSLTSSMISSTSDIAIFSSTSSTSTSSPLLSSSSRKVVRNIEAQLEADQHAREDGDNDDESDGMEQEDVTQAGDPQLPVYPWMRSQFGKFVEQLCTFLEACCIDHSSHVTSHGRKLCISTWPVSIGI